MEKRITQSALETQNFAKNIALTLRKGGVLALYGDLGSGKTTFVQGLAQGLGITRRIVSPTFIIMRTYEQQKVALYHVDLYRIQTIQDIEGIGLMEILADKNSIVVIEWPEKLGTLLPSHTKKMHFRFLSENEREIGYE